MIQVGLADGDGAGVHQRLHHRGTGFRPAGVRGAARGGGETRQVDVVLDGERNAVEALEKLRGHRGFDAIGGFDAAVQVAEGADQRKLHRAGFRKRAVASRAISSASANPRSRQA